MAETKSQLSAEEMLTQEGADLPPREVMSLVMPDTALLSGMPDTGIENPSSGPSGPAAGTATGTANDAMDVANTNAAGNQSGTPSVTDAPRSETISQSDSATAVS